MMAADVWPSWLCHLLSHLMYPFSAVANLVFDSSSHPVLLPTGKSKTKRRWEQEDTEGTGTWHDSIHNCCFK